MGKNIVVCCDGTGNEFAENNTNVVKLYYTLEQDPAKQVTEFIDTVSRVLSGKATAALPSVTLGHRSESVSSTCTSASTAANLVR